MCIHCTYVCVYAFVHVHIQKMYACLKPERYVTLQHIVNYHEALTLRLKMAQKP